MEEVLPIHDRVRFDIIDFYALLARTKVNALYNLYHMLFSPSTLAEVRKAVLP